MAEIKNDGYKTVGNFIIELRRADTGTLMRRLRVKNQLTAINQTVRSQMLAGTYTGTLDALQIKYLRSEHRPTQRQPLRLRSERSSSERS